MCCVYTVCVRVSAPHLPVELLLPVALLSLSLTLEQHLVLPLGLLLLLSSFQGVPQDPDLPTLQHNLLFHLLQLITQDIFTQSLFSLGTKTPKLDLRQRKHQTV